MIGKTNTFSISGAPVFSGRYVEIDVIGGTTRPSQMANNTIWINTSTPISSWYISSQAPENPSAGTVWIMIDYESDIQLELSNIPYIGIGIGTSYQYIDSDWTIVPAEIYTNKKYYASNLVLYNHGVYNNDYTWVTYNPTLVWCTGEWVNQNTTYKDILAITNRTDYIEISYSAHNPTYAAYSLHYIPLIDITEYSQLSITYECTKSTDARTIWFSVTPEGKTKAKTYDNATTVYSWTTGSARSKRTETLDISGLTGENYITIGAYGGQDKVCNCKLKIYSIELIKEAT